jgi:hypothetical protein
MAANVTRENARALLPQHDLPDEQLDIVIDMVRAWLLEATGLDALPDPLDDFLWASAVELAALLADNPASLMSRQTGPTGAMWPQRNHRESILNRVRKRYRAKRMAPQGSYPAPSSWPQPAELPPGRLGDATGAVWLVPGR